MPLHRGEVQGYDFDRMIVEFTMLDEDAIVDCAISTVAMDDIEHARGVKAEQRVEQFLRLRDVIEERASRKFEDEHARPGRVLVLRSNDFVK
ncbi:MAG TPA: DUF1488 family protein [Xanthobacteraceae bacterium]|jgi:hypothetical protein|nr:DUF1488 family protein [Xanthobacteraceae bacterium]